MKNQKYLKSSSGFSLLEVVITLALMVVIIFAISNLMRSSFEIKDSLSNKNRITQRINVAMAKISGDLTHAFLLDSREKRSDNRKRTIFKIEKSSRGDVLSMTYMAHEPMKKNSKESELSYVIYEIKESEKFPHRSDLYRGELPRIPKKDYRFKEKLDMQLFVPNIKSISFEPWRGDDWQKDGWDSTSRDTTNLLPHMVRIFIEAWTDDPVEGLEPDEISENSLTQLATVVYLPYSLDFKELRSRNSTFRLQ